MHRQELKPESLNTRNDIERLITNLFYAGIVQRRIQFKDGLNQVRLVETAENSLAQQFLVSSSGETYLLHHIKGLSPEVTRQYPALTFLQNESCAPISLAKIVHAFSNPHENASKKIINHLVYNLPLAQALLSGHYGEDEMLRISALCQVGQLPVLLPKLTDTGITIDAYHLSNQRLPFKYSLNCVTNHALKQLLMLSFIERQERKYRIAFFNDKTHSRYLKLKKQKDDIENAYQDLLAQLSLSQARLREEVLTEVGFSNKHFYFSIAQQNRPGIELLSSAELNEERERYIAVRAVIMKQFDPRLSERRLDPTLMTMLPSLFLLMFLLLYFKLQNSGLIPFVKLSAIYLLLIATLGFISSALPALNWQIETALIPQFYLNIVIKFAEPFLTNWINDIDRVLAFKAVENLPLTPKEIELRNLADEFKSHEAAARDRMGTQYCHNLFAPVKKALQAKIKTFEKPAGLNLNP